MKKIENIYYTESKSERQSLDIYLPDCEAFPVLVYFHGGGIEGGSKNDPVFYGDLVKRGIAVVAANYRIYPSAVYPDFIRDAAAAVAWAHKHMPEYGTVSDFFVGGSSAGGYITQMLCFDKKYLAMHKIDADNISGYIMDAGQPTVHFNVLAERGLDSRRIIVDAAAPLYHVCVERSYPPLNIIVSDNDMQNRYEQTMLLVSTLKHFGHEAKTELRVVKNSTHCSYLGKVNDEGRNAFADMVCDFIFKHTKDLR